MYNPAPQVYSHQVLPKIPLYPASESDLFLYRPGLYYAFEPQTGNKPDHSWHRFRIDSYIRLEPQPLLSEADQLHHLFHF